MIPVPSGVRVWIATGHTDMRRGMNSLALQIQQALNRGKRMVILTLRHWVHECEAAV
jgi:transposase